MEKNRQRQLLLDVLTAMSADERVRKSMALSINLEKYLSHFWKSLESIVVGVYAPMPTEVDWTINPKLHSLQCAFPLPCGERQMSFHQCQVNELEWQKAFGVKMRLPPKESPEVLPDLIVVPGLGFTAHGQRLGRGGGYYDRWLAGFKGKKIGLCFEEQLLQELPTDPHDVVMDAVVTDKRILPSP